MKHRILAIDPGTRHTGVALLENGKLIYHAVKEIKSHQSSRLILRDGRRIILHLIKDFKPDLLAVEKVFVPKNRPRIALVNVFVSEIKAIAKRKKIRCVWYAPSTVKKFICGYGWADKEKVAQCVALRYPELKVYLTQDRAWKERYHWHMFDAVAVGLTAFDQKNRLVDIYRA